MRQTWWKSISTCALRGHVVRGMLQGIVAFTFRRAFLFDESHALPFGCR